MASRISQMRNVTPQQLQSRPQLNQSIESVRNMMHQLRGIPNWQSTLVQMLQNNPNMQPILNLMNSNGNLEEFAKSLASYYNVDPNQLISELLK